MADQYMDGDTGKRIRPSQGHLHPSNASRIVESAANEGLRDRGVVAQSSQGNSDGGNSDGGNSEDGGNQTHVSQSMPRLDGSEEQQQPSQTDTSLDCRGDDNEGSADQQKEASRNVPLILRAVFCFRLSWNLIEATVLSAFVFLIRSDNPESVGFVLAIRGAGQAVSAFPTGALADRYRRDTFLRASSLVLVLAIATTIVSVVKRNYAIFCVAVGMWGIFMGISDTASTALFADSIYEGERSKRFTQRSIVLFAAFALAPAVAMIMFLALGNQWTVEQCSVVIFASQVVAVPAIALLCLADDDYSVRDHASVAVDSESTLQEHLLVENSLMETRHVATRQFVSEVTDVDMRPSNCGCCSNNRFIAMMVLASMLMFSFASGISIGYFPVFFLDNLHISPATVQALNFLSYLLVTLLAHWAQVASLRIGRCEISVIVALVGGSMMLAMVAVYERQGPTSVVCIFYVLRTSIINCTDGLTKSILMDAVPKQERGKWSMLDSMSIFTWSASAAIGGVMIARRGIVFNFQITAVLQMVAILPLVPLFHLVPHERTSSEENLQTVDILAGCPSCCCCRLGVCECHSELDTVVAMPSNHSGGRDCDDASGVVI